MDIDEYKNKLKQDVFCLTNRVSIELSNLCNYACLHKKCPLSLEKIPKILPQKMVFSIIDTLCKHNFKKTIAFHTYNEPLIDPRLFLFIKYAKERCPESNIMIMTNGYYMNQTLVDELIEIGVTELYVTAYTDIEYNRFKNIKSNIPFYIQAHELDDRLNIYDRPIEYYEKKPCYAPLNEIIITREAKISLCCLDWKRNYCFGDLNEQSLEEIILNSNIIETYKFLSQGDRVLEICKVCQWSR